HPRRLLSQAAGGPPPLPPLRSCCFAFTSCARSLRPSAFTSCARSRRPPGGCLNAPGGCLNASAEGLSLPFNF
ncbi:hypothetical protein KJ975_14120, partial [Myxococcota bacterium]|nr:hypothetical protein [Myxococcota bacterium]